MESNVLGRSIVVERRYADKAYELIDFFASRGYATVVEELYYGKYAEFVIGDCDEGNLSRHYLGHHGRRYRTLLRREGV